MRLDPQHLKPVVEQIFERNGCQHEEAVCIADHLIGANLSGYDTHGLIRIPRYVDGLKSGNIKADRNIELLVNADTLTVADAQLGFGQWVGKQAVDISIEKCKKEGIALLGLRNAAHLGRIGHWSEMATQEGLVALHFVNSSGAGMFVVPSGGRDPRLSVNVVSAGIPVEGATPVILDMTVAAATEGALMVARNQGTQVSEGLIVDAEGNPTRDPNEFYGPPRGAILPMAGHKGFGLGLVIDLLAGALAGGGCSSEGKTRLEQSMLGIYIDPKKLDADDYIPQEIQRYIDFVKSSRPASSDESVRIPGETAQSNRAQRASGFEVDAETWTQVVEIAIQSDIDPALIESAQLDNQD